MGRLGIDWEMDRYFIYDSYSVPRQRLFQWTGLIVYQVGTLQESSMKYLPGNDPLPLYKNHLKTRPRVRLQQNLAERGKLKGRYYLQHGSQCFGIYVHSHYGSCKNTLCKVDVLLILTYCFFAVLVAVAVIVGFKLKSSLLFFLLTVEPTNPCCFGKSAKYEASTSHNGQGWTFVVAF